MTLSLTDELATIAGDVTALEQLVVLDDLELLDADEVPVWAVIVGGSLALALAYGAYCTATRGSYSLQWTWRGLQVTCYR